MTSRLRYDVNTAGEVAIAEHLARCDMDFTPPLSNRVRIAEYASKIAHRATCFEAWSGDLLVGLVAAYFGFKEPRVVHITSISVLKESAGRGIATVLLKQCLQRAGLKGITRVTLEVSETNLTAVKLYAKFDFQEIGRNGQILFMECITNYQSPITNHQSIKSS